MKNKSRLEVLGIGRNRLENKGAKALARLLNKKKNFVKLDIQQNGIKEEGIIELLKSIGKNKAITELYLNDNWVKGEEVIRLMDVITRECKSLRVLDLSDNNIGNTLSTKLFEILLRNAYNLEEFYYNYNELDQHGAIKRCLRAVARFKKLKTLEMDGSELTMEAVNEYEEMLKSVKLKLCEEEEDI